MAATPTGILFYEGRAKPLNTVGGIQPGAYYLFYLTGTLTPANVYSDGLLSTPLSQTPGTGGTTAASDGRLVPIYMDPAVIYRYQLYSSAGVLLEDVDPYIPDVIPTAQQIGKVLYPQTAAELLLGVTPTNYQYPGDPYIDPRRYGADPTNNSSPTAITTTTTAIQTAINVAYQTNVVGGSGMIWLGNGCKYRINPVSLTITASATAPLRIVGSSQIGSALIAATGTSTPLVTFTTSNVNVGPLQAYLQLQDFSIVSGAIVSGGHGLQIIDISEVLLDNVRITNFDRNIDLQNCLDVTLRECGLLSGNYGIKIGLAGTYTAGGYPTPNLIRIDNCIIGLNAFRAVDYDGGTGLYIRGSDMESNGTPIATTATLSSGATSATLTAAWPFASGQYITVFSDYEQKLVTYTKSSTAVSWTGGLSANQTAAFLAPTGAIFIGPANSPDLLEGHISMFNTWLESNQTNFVAAVQTNGCAQRIDISACEFIGASNGQEIAIAGCHFLFMMGLQSASSGDTYSVAADFGTFINCSPANWLISGVTTPYFINCSSSGGGNASGVQGQATLTCVGLSGTCLVNFFQQGSEITAIFTDTETSSSSTSFTMTGLPTKYQPPSTYELPILCYDASTATDACSVVITNSGTITFKKNGAAAGWTGTGLKGVRRCIVRYRLDI
jgi:hypothetical protein